MNDTHRRACVSEEILAATIEALRSAAEPRFFRTERGYHGRFYCTLQAALDRRRLLINGLILEMEYQKTTRHDMAQRPDIILHIPAEESGASVRDNNLAVFALKWRASRAEALADFGKLDEMCERFGYPTTREQRRPREDTVPSVRRLPRAPALGRFAQRRP